MKQIHSMTEEHTRLPVTDVFNCLSKGELVAALVFMHRILVAEKRRDLERLVTELPELFGHTHDRGSDRWEQGGFRGKSPSSSERTYHVLSYFIFCLSKAQARIDSAKPGSMACAKRSCRLSPRELTVLQWMKDGKTNWEIARILGLSERTVRFHVGGIFEKLDVTSRTQAVARALGTGLIAS